MRSLILIIFLLGSGYIYATDVSGVHTGVWDVAGSPYVVIGNVEIPSGGSLTIEPGVSVQFNGAFQIVALGMLVAQGTETDSIYFDRYPTYSGYWDELRLEQESGDGYEISYCYIRGAENGVNSIDAPLHLHHCHLEGNTKGVHLFAIGNPDPPEVLIEHCLIELSYENGIDIYENGNATIQNCEITNNGMGTQYRGAIQVNIQTNGCVCSPTIINNNIHDNNKQGITCTDMFSAGVINAHIENNLIERNLTGVYFYNCGGTLVNNQINDNFIPGDMNSGAGVMCYGSLSTPDIAENVITGNYTALYIVNNANPCLGDIYGILPEQQGMNTFQENIDANGNNNSVYVFNCANTYTIMAENNTWDSDDFGEIAATIYDGNDNPSLPEVDFDPVYDPPEQLLSGIFEYMGGYEMNNWTLNLVSVNYSLDIETFPIEYGSFELDVIPPGYYFAYITGTSIEGMEAVGSYGDWRFPAVLTINESSQYTDLEIEVHDYEERQYYHVPRVIEEGGIMLYHYIEGGMFPYMQGLLYEDGDYLRYWGKPQYDDEGWYVEEFIDHQEFMKIHNIMVGDDWTSLRLWGGDESIHLHYEVTAKDTLEINEELREVFTFEATWGSSIFLEEKFADDLGLISQLVLNQQELLVHNYQLNSDTVILPGSEPSFLPLGDGYFTINMLEVNPLSPWNLEFVLDNEEATYLMWNPPCQSTDCESYRIYANEELLEEIDVEDRQYAVPANLIEDTDFYITGYDGDTETEPTNTITWIVPVINDADQAAPAVTQLNQNYPNPFFADAKRAATVISFSLAKDSAVELSIYNSRGQKIIKLYDGRLKRGNHQYHWNGNNQAGLRTASGVYFYQLATGDQVLVQKLMLLR